MDSNNINVLRRVAALHLVEFFNHSNITSNGLSKQNNGKFPYANRYVFQQFTFEVDHFLMLTSHLEQYLISSLSKYCKCYIK